MPKSKTNKPTETMQRREKFATALKAWRERHALSQSDAARVLRVSVATLRGWEIERTSPSGLLYTLLMEKLERD